MPLIPKSAARPRPASSPAPRPLLQKRSPKNQPDGRVLADIACDAERRKPRVFQRSGLPLKNNLADAPLMPTRPKIKDDYSLAWHHGFHVKVEVPRLPDGYDVAVEGVDYWDSCPQHEAASPSGKAGSALVDIFRLEAVYLVVEQSRLGNSEFEVCVPWVRSG